MGNDDFDLESEFSDELDALETAREAVAGDPNVSFVSIGARLDEDGDLERAIWVRLDGDVDGLDELRDDLDLPVEAIDLRDVGAGMSTPVAEDGVPRLQERVRPPLAGYEISPDVDFTPQVATLGMLGTDADATHPGENRKLVSAAHPFAAWDPANEEYRYSGEVRQPASDSQRDRIGGNPKKPLSKLDVIGYSLDVNGRNWPNASRIADVGNGRVSGIRPPQDGLRVTKVGRTTGVTSGRITLSTDAYFVVEPDDPEEPISDHGDSGAPWVTVTDDGDPKWVGINLKSGRSTSASTEEETYMAMGVRAEIVAGAIGLDLF